MKSYGKYGETAIEAVKLYKDGNLSPRDAWNLAAEKIFPDSESLRAKVCPRAAFLGLCEEGYVREIGKGDYCRSKCNKKYALCALELLKKEHSLADDKKELWKRVLRQKDIESKTHNNQMEVVVALWKNNMLV